MRSGFGPFRHKSNCGEVKKNIYNSLQIVKACIVFIVCILAFTNFDIR